MEKNIQQVKNNNDENKYEEKIIQLEQKIESIEKRNKRVELDKRWETCFTRRICICIMTYAVVLLYSYLIRNLTSVSIFLTSFVPVIGFTLSNLSLKFIRKIWEKKLSRKENE